MKQWYIATLVLQSYIGDEPHEFWEQIHAIRATSAAIAYDKSLALGQAEESTYLNQAGETVSWKFLGLNDLEELPVGETIRDSTELRTRVFFDSRNPAIKVSPRDKLSVFLNRSKADADHDG